MNTTGVALLSVAALLLSACGPAVPAHTTAGSASTPTATPSPTSSPEHRLVLPAKHTAPPQIAGTPKPAPKPTVTAPNPAPKPAPVATPTPRHTPKPTATRPRATPTPAAAPTPKPTPKLVPKPAPAAPKLGVVTVTDRACPGPTGGAAFNVRFNGAIVMRARFADYSDPRGLNKFTRVGTAVTSYDLSLLSDWLSGYLTIRGHRYGVSVPMETCPNYT